MGHPPIRRFKTRTLKTAGCGTRPAPSVLGKTVCIIHPEHVRSIRVAEKCGFKEVQRTTYKGEPTILFAR